MIEQLPVIIGVVILAGAILIVSIWVEREHRKEQKLLKEKRENLEKLERGKAHTGPGDTLTPIMTCENIQTWGRFLHHLRRSRLRASMKHHDNPDGAPRRQISLVKELKVF